MDIDGKTFLTQGWGEHDALDFEAVDFLEVKMKIENATGIQLSGAEVAAALTARAPSDLKLNEHLAGDPYEMSRGELVDAKGKLVAASHAIDQVMKGSAPVTVERLTRLAKMKIIESEVTAVVAENAGVEPEEIDKNTFLTGEWGEHENLELTRADFRALCHDLGRVLDMPITEEDLAAGLLARLPKELQKKAGEIAEREDYTVGIGGKDHEGILLATKGQDIDQELKGSTPMTLGRLIQFMQLKKLDVM